MPARKFLKGGTTGRKEGAESWYLPEGFSCTTGGGIHKPQNLWRMRREQRVDSRPGLEELTFLPSLFPLSRPGRMVSCSNVLERLSSVEQDVHSCAASQSHPAARVGPRRGCRVTLGTQAAVLFWSLLLPVLVFFNPSPYLIQNKDGSIVSQPAGELHRCLKCQRARSVPAKALGLSPLLLAERGRHRLGS